MPSVQPNRLVPGRHGHASAAAASAFAARPAAQPAARAPALKLVPPPVVPAAGKGVPGAGKGVRAARRHRKSVVAQDHASYQCACGNLFTAAVSTTVACPGCGGAQSW